MTHCLSSFISLQKRCLALLIVGSLCIAPACWSQSVCLPLPRLLTTMPMGGAAGTEVEITITGENIEEAGDLFFSHPGLVGVPKRNANGQPEPNRYFVTIASDCPAGIYEARVMTRLGISSARVFSVGTLPEVTQTTVNTSLATAMPLDVNSVCNAVMTTKAVDHYRFEGKKGQRYSAHCAAREIDSKLDAVLIIADAAGRDLVVERRGGTLDFTAPEDGPYVIKVHELTFKGGAAYFYRLTLQELAAEAPLPRFASTRDVHSFSWPPKDLNGEDLNSEPATKESEPNQSHAQAQKLSLPCDLAGSFFPAADVDTFEFTATKGDVWWVEVASERLGRPTDPSIIVQQVSGPDVSATPAADGSPPIDSTAAKPSLTFTDVAEFSDIPSPLKPSSNGYTYDGPPYNGGSSDILGKLEIKQSGVHHLQLSDLFGGTRNDDRNVYRLIIRQANPDFALVAWGLHMELRNGDRNALSKPVALRGGTTMALEVIAMRRDGFDGEIELVMEGLPDGVTAQGLKIPAGQSRGIMLITAHAEAPRAVKTVSFSGRSQINGQSVTRPVHMAAMAWPVVDSWSETPRPRLVSDLQISVCGAELAPLSITTGEQKRWEAVVGEKLTIPLVFSRRSEFSGSTLQLKASGHGFEKMPRLDVPITADRSEAVLDLAALKTPPGDYLIALYGSAVAKYRYNPDAVTAAQAAHEQAQHAASLAAAESQKLTAAATQAPADAKAAAEQAAAEGLAKKQAADKALLKAAETLKAVSAKALPKDTVDIVVSEPIAIRVKAAEAK